MNEFMGRDFLLRGESSKTLFYEYADKMPIIDYHCHIDPSEIYNNKRFATLTEAWLGGDHYKWRLMRANGAGERYVTGEASDWEKFLTFASVLPKAPGNPVYQWAHLELRRFFGCDKPLGPDTAREIWDFCNAKLASDENLSVRGILKQMNVEAIITTDDPADSLDWHKELADDKTCKTCVLPGWRPSSVLNADAPGFTEYIRKLGEVSGFHITTFDDLKASLLSRMEYFNRQGCRASDHGIERITFAPAGEEKINAIFTKRLLGETLTAEESNRYLYAVLTFCAKEYARLGWVMQLHLGAVRDINSVMYDGLGPDSGYDFAGKSNDIYGLARFLDGLNTENLLPKTLIFSTDPADNLTVNTLAWCFTQEGIKGKVQQGSAWWFNDTCTGVKQQLTTFAEEGALGNFVGMLTDSRSFLSYPRHEYFRRILCGVLGEWIDSGMYPAYMDIAGGLIQDICYNNAKEFFRL